MKAELEAQGYSVFVAEQPRVTDEDVFSSMFAVGADTHDEERAMEIITYLNTDATVRNLLQYGIEGKNYELKTVAGEDGTERAYAQYLDTNTYWMDITKTGNMFVAYPNAAESNVAEGEYGVMHWEIGKLQNLDAATYPTVGMHFSREEFIENSSGFKVDDESIRILNAVSAKVKVKLLDPLKTPEEVQALYDEASAFTMDYEGMAKFLLNKIGESITYTMPGQDAPVQVTEYKLTVALRGMAETYRADATNPGTMQSAAVLYQEWRDSNGYKDAAE